MLTFVFSAGVALAALPTGGTTADISPDLAAAMAINDLAAVDGGYELRHPRHSATFLGDGIQVTPRGGSPAWVWRLGRVGPAGSDVSLVDTAGAELSQPEASIVRYQRLALDEEYVLGTTSIEQRFILHVPPPLDGRDLVLEGSVLCDGEFRPTSRGWEWRGNGGLVWLGPATVFDANGTVLPSRFQVTASSTRLVVDGAALAGAAYPVTIDPEIGANDFRISDMGPDGDPNFSAEFPVVTHNRTLNEYLVVWAGSSDHGGLVIGETEIFGQFLDADGAQILANDFRISDVGGTGEPGFFGFHPDVAWNSLRNQYLVVWTANDPKDGAADDETEIWGQLLDFNGGGLGPNDFRISRMGPDGSSDFSGGPPAVTFNSTTDEYLVVWSGDHHTGGLVEGESEIWAQRVDWSGALIGSSLRMSDMGGTGDPDYDAYRPDVAYNQREDQYLIVWYGDDNTGGLVNGEFEVYGQLITATGSGVGPNDYRLSDMGGVGDPSFDGNAPTVAYNSRNNEYLVVWSGDDNTGGLVDNEREVFSQRLTANLVGLGPNDYRLSDVGGIGDPDYGTFFPHVSYNAATNEYAVVWYGDDTVGGTVDDEFEVYCQLLTSDIAGIGPNDARISDIGGLGNTVFGVDHFLPPPVSVVANSETGEFLAVWAADDPVDGIVDNENEIFGQRVHSPTVFIDDFESADTSAWSAVVP